MKKILIIDTPENCAIAKKLFESKENYEKFAGYCVAFCSNFLEAKQYILESNAVIVGMGIPYSDEKLFNVNFDYIESDRIQISKLTYSEKEVLEFNSYLLLFLAQFLKKQVIAVSEHNSDLQIIVAKPNRDYQAFKAAGLISQNFKEQYDPELLTHSYDPDSDPRKYFKCPDYLELLEQAEENPSTLNLFQLWLYAKMGKTKIDRIEKGLTKKSFRAWEIALEELQKQF